MIPGISDVEEIVHAADVEAVERKILQLAMERTGSVNGGVFLWDERSGELRIDWHVVEDVEIALPGISIKRRTDGGPNGIAFTSAEKNVSYLTNDAHSDPNYAEYYVDVQSIIAAPIPYQDRAIGVISVSAEQPDAYTPEHVAEVELIARSAATFLRRAQLYRQTQQEGRRPALIKGLSPGWLEVERLVERVSYTDAPVLIRGESGTGKELVAYSIHFNSGRADKPFVTVNCAAIPEQLLESTLFGHVKGAFTGATRAKMGEFQRADGGTLFLDELGELTPALQAKTLRAIELGEIQPLGSSRPPQRKDVRVLAATNRDLEAMRRVGAFRDDLFFRVAVVSIPVPPLRTYLNNIEILCRVFVTQANQRYGRDVRGVSEEALARLRAYHFPGNMRELRNIVDHGVLVTDQPLIRVRDLPMAAHTPPPEPSERPRGTLAELRRIWVAERERAYIAQLLEELEGNVRATAMALGVDRTTLYRLLKKHGLRLRKHVER